MSLVFPKENDLAYLEEAQDVGKSVDEANEAPVGDEARLDSFWELEEEVLEALRSQRSTIAV